MRFLAATFALIALSSGAGAAEPAPDARKAIDRGLAFLAKDSLAWKEKRKCASCHHVPMTIWALSEAKNRGHAVDEKALADLAAWVIAKDDRAKVFNEPKEPPKKENVPPPKKETIVNVNEGALLLGLGFVAGGMKAEDAQAGLKRMLATVLKGQNEDGSWRLTHEPRPIGASPDVMTTLALLALSAPNAPDLGKEGKASRERGLKWLRGAKPDDDQQAAALRLILWRRLGLPATEWAPLVKKLRAAQNADGGWAQTKAAKSDAYATGQALYALAEADVKPADEAVRRAQSFLAKTQAPDGAWEMATRAILPSGKLATNVEPITHAGSAWAVMGLVRSSPGVAKAGRAPDRGWIVGTWRSYKLDYGDFGEWKGAAQIELVATSPNEIGLFLISADGKRSRAGDSQPSIMDDSKLFFGPAAANAGFSVSGRKELQRPWIVLAKHSGGP